MQYSNAIDQQITDMLRTGRPVTPDMLAGIPDDVGLEFLRYYAQIHAQHFAVHFDGARLTVSAPPSVAPAQPVAPSQPASSPQPVAAATPGAAVPLSPVDQVLSQPQGASLLDTAPSGSPVPKWLWALPFGFGIFGGVIAWIIARDANKSAAKAMLIAGIVVTIVSIAFSAAFTPVFGRVTGRANTEWDQSTSGHPTLYVFGDPGNQQQSLQAQTIGEQLGALYTGRLDVIVYPDSSADDTAMGLLESHKIAEFPTVVLVTPDGKEVDRWVGQIPADKVKEAVEKQL